MCFEIDFLEVLGFLESLLLQDFLDILVILEVLGFLEVLVSRDKRSSLKCIPPKGMEVSGN